MTTLRRTATPANMPLLLMALAILADGITTTIAINVVGLAESNPLANLLGADGPMASLLFRAALVIVLYFWASRRMTGGFRRVFNVALAAVTGLTFAFASITAIIILIEVFG